jgi:hypothetical protein
LLRPVEPACHSMQARLSYGVLCHSAIDAATACRPVDLAYSGKSLVIRIRNGSVVESIFAANLARHHWDLFAGLS